MIGVPGRSADAEAIDRILETGAGGVILFRRNGDDAGSVRDLVAGLRAAIPWPLLVAIDQEGGAVIRIEHGVTVFPGAMALGAADDEELAEAQGRITGAELAALGVDLVLAPVVDLQADDRPAVLGVRALGAEPGRVARLAAALVRGQHRGGVASCLKHAPGLGGAALDPHVHVAVIEGGEAAVNEHLEVFARTLAGLGAARCALMTTHALLPGLDPARTVTTSPRLVRELVRDRLGFDGAVLSDDLEMGGALASAEVPELAVDAAAAGHDLLLVCHDRRRQVGAARALAAALAAGRLDADEHARACARIAALRRTSDAPASPPAPGEGAALARRIARAAVRTGGDRRAPGRIVGPVVLLWPHPRTLVEVEDLAVADASRRAAAALARGGLEVAATRAFDPAAPELDVAAVLTDLPAGPLLLGLWEAGRLAPMRALLDAVLARPDLRARTVVLALRNPRDLALAPQDVPALTAFGWRDPHLEALAAALTP